MLAVILPATMLIAGCGTRGPALPQATTQSCFAFGVQALQRHETVTRLPAACAGLGVWIAFMATAEPALGWIAVGITFLVAGLGMATLLTAMPDPQRSGPQASSTSPTSTVGANTLTVSTATAGTMTASAVAPSKGSSGARPPVIVIALHGVFATITILVVLLAAIGAG
jgi:hypothetical protein